MGHFDEAAGSAPQRFSSPDQVGRGVAEIARLSQQRGQPSSAPAQRRAGPNPDEILNAARERDEERGKPWGDDEGDPVVDPITDEDIGDIADLLDGKPAREAKPKAPEKGTIDEKARERALDRLKVPKALREAMADAAPEEVDAWIEELVQNQGQTDDALQKRDQTIGTLRADLDALRAKVEGKAAPAGAKTSNAAKPGDQHSDDGGDQDEDLESLRDVDPEVAEALARRDARQAKLAKENRDLQRRLQAVEAKGKAEAEALRRQVVSDSIRTLQEELGIHYPGLHSIETLKASVLPRALALLKAGIHTDPMAAMREAAHAAFSGVAQEDRETLARRQHDPQKTPVAKATGNTSVPGPRGPITKQEAADIFVRLQDQNPSWSKARLMRVANERIKGREIVRGPAFK